MKIDKLNSWIDLKEKPLLIAGPCSIESIDQLHNVAQEFKKHNKVHVFRGGAWKPRTRPNSFEGLGEIALPWLKEIKYEYGFKTTTEVASAKHVELALKHEVDILWIGARSTVNPFTVQEIADALAGVDIPIMVKNPINVDLQLWLGAFERLNLKGITKLIAIHRGFSVGQKLELRNDPLWRIPLELKLKAPELPIICDPSHITGNRELILKVAQKAMDLDMDGLMIETHPNPEKAWSDADQQVTPQKLFEILNTLEIKKEFCENHSFDEALSEFRRQIDRLDHELIQILNLRKNIIHKIAHSKLENNVTALQKHRFEELMRERMTKALELNLDAEFIKEIFSAIHEQSIKEQTDIFNIKENN